MQKQTFILIFLLASAVLPAEAQNQKDKASADQMVFELLRDAGVPQNYYRETVVEPDSLHATNEKGLFRYGAAYYQFPGISASFYLKRTKSGYGLVFGKRYPLESLTNLLLNRLNRAELLLPLAHHQYGGRVENVTTPLQTLFDVLARQAELYCDVTAATADMLKAVLIMHFPGRDEIHLLTVEVPPAQLFAPGGGRATHADLYTNIPQANIKSLFNEKEL
ncbi:MAG: hypothetical protein IJ722_02635 [Alloprevotella sp.]|nr:hypothetical protein [Alloprevotella sp.]